MYNQNLSRLGRITHKILEDTERIRVGLLRPEIGADEQTANRISLHMALCLNGWPWDEAESFAIKEFPRLETKDHDVRSISAKSKPTSWPSWKGKDPQ